MQLIEKWDCANNIVNMVFDTTVSNTGHLTAVCVCIHVLFYKHMKFHKHAWLCLAI